MFYGRKEYVERFMGLWRKPVPSLVVCRGRRRIGKSTLVKEFARQSGSFYLKFEGLAPDARMTNAKQLAAFRDQLSAQTGKPVPRLKDWSEAFRELDAALVGVDGRKVVLLDEVSWMGCRDRAFAAKLKVAWDNLLHERADLIVFICGSVSTWIKKNILSSRGFVGRIALDTVVQELPLADCVRFWRGRASRIDTRFFLRYVSPRIPEIEAGVFSFAGVELLPGWDSMMGLQFENLVLNNFAALAPLLNLQGRLVVSAAPFRCTRSSRGGGVQVDLLVQTEGTAYVVEVKRSRGDLGVEVADEIRSKVARLPVRHGMFIRTALVYDGHLTRGLEASDAIDVFVPASQILGIR